MSDNNNESMTGKLAEAVAEPAKEATQTVTAEMKKVAREAAIVVLAPVVKKATTSIAKQAATRGPELFQEHLAPRIEEAGGIGNLAKQATGSSGLKGMAIGKAAESVIGKVTGGKGGGSADGTGRGRRLPVQESIDVGVPIDVAYNEWTQFEQFPEFMHRVERIEQIDDTHLVWHENIWGRRRQWKAEITDQTPNQRIAWRSEDGVENVGVLTFHDIGDRLTRILVNMDFQPKGLMEKTASGFRMSRRALRSDLMRFKAHIEMKDEEDGAWRGTIEDGEVTDYDEDYENPRSSDDDRDAGDEDARDTSDEFEDDYDEDEPSDEYEDEDAEDQEDDVDEPSDEYEDEDEDDVDEASDEYEDEDEEPSDEYEEEDEDEDEEGEPSDEYEDDDEEQDEAPAPQARRRRRQAEDQGRRGTDVARKATSGARKATSGGRKAASSSPRKATSGARKTASSAAKSTSGARKKASSSPRKATAAASKATSGTRKAATSSPRKATSGARKTASSAAKGTSGARKTASSGARKATSGARKTASSGTRGARKATSSKSR